MMALHPVDILLSLAVLAIVTLTLVVRSRKTQVLGFLGLGVILSTVWLRLTNLDIGLAEAALGSGILSAVLVMLAGSSTATRAQRTQQAAQVRVAPRWTSTLIGVVSGAVITLVVITTWARVEQSLPQWSDGVGVAMDRLPVDHDITGVLLAFRSYDTLLESAVLMFAAVLARALMPDDALHGAATISSGHATIAQAANFHWPLRVLAPLLLLVGLWLLFAGTSGPGGAFQSGALIAGMLILAHLAGVRLQRFIAHWLSPLAILGVGVFILAGILGPLTGTVWLAWPAPIAYATILTVEICLTVGIAAALFTLYVVLTPSRDLIEANTDQPEVIA